MAKTNMENARLKKRHADYLTHAKRLCDTSVDQALAAVNRFETFNKRRPFKTFRIEQAKAFKTFLMEKAVNERTGKPLSLSTTRGILKAVKGFFLWLADQQGYRAAISYSDCDYFNLGRKEDAQAQRSKPKEHPSVAQVIDVLDQMPRDTDIQKRNRAMIALAALTGIRISALISLRLKHVNVAQGYVFQDAREVDTKFAKTMHTAFFPIGDGIRDIVLDWIDFLKTERLAGPTEPLFPKSRTEAVPGRGFQTVGLDRQAWSSDGPAREIIKKAFADVGLHAFGPHSFRHMLAHHAVELNLPAQQMLAWSRNLGHDNLATTLSCYAKTDAQRTADILREI